MKNTTYLLVFLCSSLLMSQQTSFLDGNRYLTYSNEKAEISVNLSKDRQHGKYYILDVGIYNNTNQTLHFNPGEIRGHIVRKDKKS